MTRASRLVKFAASLLCLALAAAAPGLVPYAALAQVMQTPGSAVSGVLLAPSPVGGAVAEAYGSALPVSLPEQAGPVAQELQLLPVAVPVSNARVIGGTHAAVIQRSILGRELESLPLGHAAAGVSAASRIGSQARQAIGRLLLVPALGGLALARRSPAPQSSPEKQKAPFDRWFDAAQIVEGELPIQAGGSWARLRPQERVAPRAFSSIALPRRMARSVTPRPVRRLELSGLKASPPSSTSPQPSASLGGAMFEAVKSFSWIAAGAVVAAGSHLGLALAWPHLFGAVPMAAAWSVASGAVLFPLAVFGRTLLARHGEKSLGAVKALLDLSLGGFLGAAALAAAAYGLLSFPLSLPLAGAAVGVSSLAGMGALAAMTTITMYLAQIVGAAKSGFPLKITGSPLGWPVFFWAGLGAYFAHLSGFTTTNLVLQVAFGAWMFLNGSRVFNWAYWGAFAYALFTGWASPLTFVVLAFFPERAAKWTAQILERLYRGRPNLAEGLQAPLGEDAAGFYPDHELPTGPLNISRGLARADQALKGRYPNFHYTLKTVLFYGVLAAFYGAAGAFVFGFKGLLLNTLLAGAFSFLTFWFSHKLVIAAMKGQKADEKAYPQIYRIVRELTQKKGMRMPDIYIIPTDVPNAFATGRSPDTAVVGVTMGILGLLNERQLRGVLGHELSHVLNRDMLSSTVSGALASAVAFAAYGVLWVIATAKKLAAQALDWLGSRAPRAAPQDRATPLSGGGMDRGQQPEWIDPLTGGIALKTSAGMIQVLLALWAPIVGTLLQMGISRTREAAADADGAKLTGDPLALAEALQALTTWHPRSGFRGLDRLRLPLVAATSGLFIVPMLPQFLRSQGMSGPLDDGSWYGKAARWMIGEDFLFSLFVTHPPTAQRIKRLKLMAAAGPGS